MAEAIVPGAGLGGYSEFTSSNPWVAAFEKYFLRMLKTGSIAPIHEKSVLKTPRIEVPQ